MFPPEGLSPIGSDCLRGGSQTSRWSHGLFPDFLCWPLPWQKRSEGLLGRRPYPAGYAFASSHPAFQGRQHTFSPNTRFDPRPAVSDLSDRSSLIRHSSRLFVLLFGTHVSTFLPPFAPHPLRCPQRYYGGSDSCTPLPSAQVSLLNVLNLPDHSVPKHPVLPCRRFLTLRAFAQRDRCPRCLSAFLPGLLSMWVQASPLGDRLAGGTRPKRVRYPTDWSFTSCCSPPRLAATQLQSVTGCSVDLERTCTSLIKYAHRRTTPAKAGVRWDH